MRLQARAPLGTCLVLALSAASPASAQLRVVSYVSGLTAPVAFVQDPSNPAVQYVVEQGGAIKVINNRLLQATPFLDISSPAILAPGGERGLLGLAFPSNYGVSGRFYVLYTRAGDGYIVLSRYKRSASNPLVADPGTRLDLRWSTGDRFIVHPYANHNAGCLQFGPDGMLYVASGDGGSGGDPHNFAQNTSSLLGKMLRIDVRSVPDTDPNGFVVPAGNPGLPRPEIWSLGWRNPWRFSFDLPAHGGTGAMVVGDVGQGLWEEINYEPANRPGRNYGWRRREGARDYNTSLPAGTLPLVDPVFAYDRGAGRSVTGGYVYRGLSFPALRGRYIFADYVTRRIWSLGLTVNGATGEATPGALLDHTAELAGAAIGSISSFGIDARGEIYVVDHTGGRVLKFSLGSPNPPANMRIVRD